MRVGLSVRLCTWLVLTIMGVLAPVPSAAQSSVGGGPLTTMLTDTEPTVGVLSFGRVRFAPGMTIREIGWDDNVFDEPDIEFPKEDWVAALQPDVSAFAQTTFVRVSAYAGAELTYYKTYESERSIGHAARVRADFLLSRVRPFVGLGETETRTRPNGEIDTRADRQDVEASGGLAFDIGPHSLVYGSAYLVKNTYENAIEDGIDIARTLTRRANHYESGMKTDLTPLLSVQLYASYQEDLFEFEPIRNAQAWQGSAMFRFAPDAVISGTATVAYRDMKFVDPLIKAYRGFVGVAALSYPFLEIGRLSVSLSRGVEYSFDASQAYYVEQSATIAYTHRLFGEVDAQVKGSRASFDYEARLTLPAHTDTLDTAGASVGYNLRNRTRIAMNYEYGRRRSPAFDDRNYERRRVFLSWQFAF
jgi:hypothetical protein